MITIKNKYTTKISKETVANVLRSSKNDLHTSTYLLFNKLHEDSLPQAVSNVSFAVEKVLKLYLACRSPLLLKKDFKIEDLYKTINSNNFANSQTFFL